MAHRSRPYHEAILSNPDCPPNWRMRRAQSLVASPQYCTRRRDDAATACAVDYLRAACGSPSTARLKRLQEKYRHVIAAEQLAGGSDLVRLEIECRILARETDVAISDVTGVAPETVQAYGDLFFDVRRCLDGKAYMAQLLDASPAGEPIEWRYAKQESYHMGPAAASMWLRYLRSESGEQIGLTEVEATTIRMRLAHRRAMDDDSTGPDLLKRPQILFEDSRWHGLPKPIQQYFGEWASQQLQCLHLPHEELPSESYAPTRRRATRRLKALPEPSIARVS